MGHAPTPPLADDVRAILLGLGVKEERFTKGNRDVRSPITGTTIAQVQDASAQDVHETIAKAQSAFETWRRVPAPRRGEFVRLLGEALRAAKPQLARLVTIEAGKITSEGLGEVQEMIDICDFAVGLSRQLYGLTMPSERADHRLSEQWHPMGVVGVISAFNFPVAVWSWNAALAFVCGNSVVWKPSEKTPLTALAVAAITDSVAAQFPEAPDGLSAVILGGRATGEAMVDDPRVPVVSATGSTAMGRLVGQKLAARFARAILELGGNNASIVCPSAHLDLALRAIAFGAMGTAGQRCTTLRRLIVHDSIYDSLIARLKRVYSTVSIGNPLTSDALIGPLIDEQAFTAMQKALAAARAAGGTVHGGERYQEGVRDTAFYVRPALVDMPQQSGPMLQECFAPILYVTRYTRFEDAISLQNGVPQGLSSSIFTRDMEEAERFLSAMGSDCGIANVNMGTSGAEIGGAFGGEKETGGGRESGSDAWKGYMRRMTSAINYGSAMPLAQGVVFDVEGSN